MTERATGRRVGAALDGRPIGVRPSLKESAKNLRSLAQNLAEVPEELRDAPARAASRLPGGTPLPRPGRLRGGLRMLAWPLAAIAVSGAAGVLVALASGGAPFY